MRTKVGYPNERFYLPIYQSAGQDVIDTIDTDPTSPPIKDCHTPQSPPATPPLLMPAQHQPQQAPHFATHYSMPAVVQQQQQLQQQQQQQPQMPTLPTGGGGHGISSSGGVTSNLTASLEHHDHGAPAAIGNGPNGSTTQHSLLNHEEARRKTFTAAWPHRFLDTNLLAQTGFYYIGPGDNVKCHFCKVEIGRWETNDHEVTEHQRWSQNCALLKRRLTNNVPLDAAQLDQVLPAVTIDVCGPGGIDVRHNTVSEGSFDVYPSMAAVPAVPAATHAAQSSPGHDQGPDLPAFAAAPMQAQFAQRQQHQFQPQQLQQQQQQLQQPQQFASISVQTAPPSMRPDHPEYAIESARLRSFDDWPKTMKQKPKELSDAGFFYTMKGDRVKCFSCGGGLRDWDENDVPWEQHAQWFGHCQYLQLIKGPEYVEEVLRAAAAAKDAAEQQQLGGGGLGGDAANDQTQAPAANGGTATVGQSLAQGAGSAVAASAATLNAEAAAGAADDATGAGGRKICDSKLCKICYSCEYNTAFWPCGHVVACAKCASSVTKCPMCRKPYERVMRVYFS